MILPTHINATTIPDAWFQCIYNIFDRGFSYKIDRGSFKDQYRFEYDWIDVLIENPYQEPWDEMLPKMPEGCSLPAPVEPGYIEQYLPYLMTPEKGENEDYTYGQRLYFPIYDFSTNVTTNGEWASPLSINQVEFWIKTLKKLPNTNQAVLQVAQPGDCLLADPPCLRHIDMRIKDGELIFYPYFRSWDLWAGFSANLAAIAILQKTMADEIGVDSGPIMASSKGLHVYDYAFELVKIRTGKR
jgi:thymidylate synthase